MTPRDLGKQLRARLRLRKAAKDYALCAMDCNRDAVALSVLQDVLEEQALILARAMGYAPPADASVVLLDVKKEAM